MSENDPVLKLRREGTGRLDEDIARRIEVNK